MSSRAGVTFLDHTADVGIAVAAGDLETLFHRAALGMLDLLHGAEDDDAPRPTAAPGPGASDGAPGSDASDGAPGSDAPDVPVSARSEAATADLALHATGPAPLLADWLRELLFLHEVEHRDYVAARFAVLEPTRLSAAVRTEPWTGAVREIKGVTYHELEVEEVDGGWRARVIFDV